MDILGKVNKVPGGIMVVPMFITALINTFIPAALKIGGPTSGAFSGAGAMATIGMLLFTAGSQTQTLSMVIYSMAKKRVSPEINALSTLMFIVVVGLMVVVNLRQARQDRLARQRRSALAANSH